MTIREFQGRVQERRCLTGEGYSVAAKAVIKYLLDTRQITESQAKELERSGH